MTTPILTANSLEKYFGNFQAVKGISFHIMPGEIFSLLGPNGAGKTTTISMLSSLLEPTAGYVEINGHRLPGAAMQAKELIGVVPQEIALYGALSARQNLLFWGRMYGMGGSQLKERVEAVLTQVDLVERANDRVDTYSGGMKRRINIAVGLLHKPKLLFMDEPTVGIDPQSRRRILDMVQELRAQGMAVLYTTHYMEEAEELSDRVGIMDHGELIALGTQKELTKLVGQQETLRLHFGEGQLLNGFGDKLAAIDGILQVTPTDENLVLSVTDATAVLPHVITLANNASIRVRSVDIAEPNLEGVFLHLTGRALRD
ncbi:MAG: ABC transporter ATP-binding protein [Chloroflexota bacterium]